MSDFLTSSIKTSASGLEAQSLRLRMVAENLANAQSTGSTPGSDPYRRKQVTFGAEMDLLTGATLVKVKKVQGDPKPFQLEYDPGNPGNPAANSSGYVKLPNVNMIVEMADMREASRSYESNLQAIKQAKEMISMTIDLLRSS
jgi:flagellar basal-body rod protein FlgC